MERVGKFVRTNLVGNIKDGVEKSTTTFLLTYSQVSSSQMDTLRKKLKKVGARVFVSKNRLARIALKELKQDVLGEKIKGQTAFIWSNADCVPVSKTLVDFIKGREHVLIQGGFLDGAVLSGDDVKRLSELPSREVLLATLLSVMLSPATRFAGVLNAKSRDLLSILKQLSEKKGGN